MRKLFYISNLFALGMVLSAGSAKAQAPVIGTDPHDSVICSGSVATFSVAASGTPTFFWQGSTDGIAWNTLSDGGVYAGTGTATLSVFGSSTVNGRKYRAIATNGSGDDTSAVAMITVNPLADAGVISGTNRICQGSTAALVSTMPGGAWSSSDMAVATVSGTGTVHAVTAGATTIMYIASNSCGNDTATYAFNVDGGFSHVVISGSSSVCQGSVINLSATVAGGTWTASNANATVSATGVVSGVAAGADTIKYRYANTCGADSSYAVVTVELPLTVGTILGPDTMCLGSAATFISTDPGGAWISGSGDVATADLFTGVITARGTGTTSITYFKGNACGYFFTNKDLTVVRPASMITGDDSLAIGATEMLMDSVSGGVWTSADVTIASVNATSGTVTGVAAGATTITYSVNNICGVSNAMFTIYVGTPSAAGVIAGPDSVCSGAAITLTPSVIGGTWTSTNASASVDASGMVTGLIGGMRDTIIYTVTDGFGTSTVSKVIYVNQAPVVTITGPAASDVGIGTAYNLTATPAGGTWVSSNPAAVVFISAHVFVPMAGGVTDLIYTVSNACGTTADTFVVDIPVITGVSNVAANTVAINVVPNPNNGAFAINVATAINETAHVTITNVAGVIVKEMDIDTNNNTNIDLAQPAGMYIVTAATSTKTYTTRFVVTK